MGTKIIIKVSGLEVEAELNDTQTAQKMAEALPFCAEANTWGDEIYFTIPVSAEIEDAKEVVEKGDIGYWTVGKAMCIFFGPTPASKGEEIRPASPVNIVGRVKGDPALFKSVKDGAKIEVVAVE